MGSSDAAHPTQQDVRRERGVQAVIALTAVTMVAEIAAGHWNGSMALLADGWHMATHVGALGLAGLAYVLMRRLARHEAFVFGAGKIPALAGFTSCLLLGGVAISVAMDAVLRLTGRHEVDWDGALPVALVGLVVNLASAWVLHRGAGHDHGHAHHDHDHHHDHHHDHDHDRHHDHAHHHHDHHDPIHRSALLHVVADALTSALAIVALLGGRYLGWTWLDPLTALLGAAVILQWSAGLARSTALTLLDVDAEQRLAAQVRAALGEDAKVEALHAWSTGGSQRACMVRVAVPSEAHARSLQTRLAALRFSPLVVEARVEPGT